MASRSPTLRLLASLRDALWPAAEAGEPRGGWRWFFQLIRGRLLLWYALVLVGVIGGFAGVLYYQVRTDRLRQIDARLEAASRYLEATVAGLQPRDVEGPGPPGQQFDSLGDPFRPPGGRGRGAGPNGRGPGGPGPGGRGNRGGPRGDGGGGGRGPGPREFEQRGRGERGPFEQQLATENDQFNREPRDGRSRDDASERGPRMADADRPLRGPEDGRPPRGPEGEPPQRRRGSDGRGSDGRAPADLLRTAIDEPATLFDPSEDQPDDWPYFAIWCANVGLLAASEDLGPRPPGDAWNRQAGRPYVRWRANGNREVVLAGPRGTLILVGKPCGRDLAELRTFAWQVFGSGAAVLVVGLAGGWMISRSITRPIAAISRAASAISASNLSRRIDTPEIDLELVGLATVLNDMFARLESAFDQQGRFTADASHELRTPLAIIRSHVELALSRPRSGEEYRETLSACLRAAGRMSSLVDGLLVLARADDGRLDPQFRRVDLRAIVAEVVEQFRPQAEANEIKLSTTLAHGTIVRGDASFLARIPINLLSNALRHTHSGGRVHVELRVDKRRALLAIEDTGCGIPAEAQPRVFERFFRADKARARSSGGNGLGLAICKSLVEVHQGAIRFTSSPEQGTRFEVSLPLSDA